MGDKVGWSVRPYKWLGGGVGAFYLGIGLLSWGKVGPEVTVVIRVVFPVLIIIFSSIVLISTLRAKLSLTSSEILYQGPLKSYSVQIPEVTDVTIERYDGGMYFRPNAPRCLKVVRLHGEFGERNLDIAMGRRGRTESLKRLINSRRGELKQRAG